MKLNLNRTLLLSLILSLSLISASCAKGVNTTPFTSSVRANDDIASSIKILTQAETDLEKEKLISAKEGLLIIDGLSALNAANIQYNTDLTAAKLSGNKSVLPASLNLLKKAVTELNNNGVLGLKSEKAKQIFSTTMGAINLSLAVLEGFVNKP